MSATPMSARTFTGRWLFPAAVFLIVFTAHAFYARYESRQPISGWASTGVVDNADWGFGPYLRAQDYFTGYSYALSLAFAALTLGRYRERRKRCQCAGRNAEIGGVAAIGGVAWSTILAGSGCFLLGCCGSPMLGVYLSLFGAAFLPFVKPLIAGVTTVMVVASYYWWIWRPRPDENTLESACCSPLQARDGEAPSTSRWREKVLGLRLPAWLVERRQTIDSPTQRASQITAGIEQVSGEDG